MNNTDILFSSPFNDTSILFFFIVAMLILAVFCAIALYLRMIPFLSERSYIKREMYRSGSRDEYRYWKRRLRYLYISSIPIIGSLISNYNEKE